MDIPTTYEIIIVKNNIYKVHEYCYELEFAKRQFKFLAEQYKEYEYKLFKVTREEVL